MKTYFSIFLFFSVISAFSQKEYNTNKKGFIADGYDVVSYFSNKAVEGDKEFTLEYKGVKYQFVSDENLKKFVSNPKKYTPQYGGWCAYAIGAKNEKVKINPDTFEIRDGKLYLFYNAWGINTLELWNKEGAEELQKQADKNWNVLK